MGGVGGVRLVIVAQVSVRVGVFANGAVGAGLDDLAGRSESKHPAVEDEQTIEPVVDPVEIVRRH
jgi:hypothetical protein